MVVVTDLNDYSLQVYEYLKLHHPELLDFASMEASDFGKNHLVITLKSSNDHSMSDLVLSSEDNELTVGFHLYHEHFDWLREDIFEEQLEETLTLFYNILNENLLVISAGGITTLLLKEEIDRLEAGEILKYFNTDCITYRVTSFSGKWDNVFENPHSII